MDSQGRTYHHKMISGTAGADTAIERCLQFLIPYAIPSRTIREKQKKTQFNVPARLLCSGPTNSVLSTYSTTNTPPWKNPIIARNNKKSLYKTRREYIQLHYLYDQKI
jgi:hypothetical protein